MILGGEGDTGEILLEWTRAERPYSVVFQGITGNWSLNGEQLALTDLNGSGSITVLAASPDKKNK